MKKEDGFTLVELLAMLVVLGILMAVTIPNITGILGNSRLNQTKNDAKQIVQTAKTRVAKDSAIGKPKQTECFILTLDFIDDNEEITEGANKGKYDQFESFVLYTREGSKYKYYIRLIEEKDGEYLEIKLRDSDTINDIKAANKKKTTNIYGLSKVRSGENGSIQKLNEQTEITTRCAGGIKYYVHS